VPRCAVPQACSFTQVLGAVTMMKYRHVKILSTSIIRETIMQTRLSMSAAMQHLDGASSGLLPTRSNQ
jgi:hypothetical protein